MVVLALLYVALPLWAKFTVFIINAFVPDIIPAFDEIFMMASTINHMMKIFATRQWISEHKKTLLYAIIGIVVLIILCIIIF